jgi:hypothetical protein
MGTRGITERLRRETDQSHSPTAEVTNEWSYTSTPTLVHDAHRDFTFLVELWGHAVAQMAEALRYKSEGGGFDFRCCHWNFSLT